MQFLTDPRQKFRLIFISECEEGGDTDLEFHKIYRIGSLSGDNSLISNFVFNSGKQKDSNNLTLTFSMREYILPCYLRDNISRGVKLMGKF